MKLAIIYGSESLLLKSFIDGFDGNLIRLYNNRIPEKKNNCLDIKYDSKIGDKLNNYLNQNIKNIKQIIFLGAAFATDTKLFWSENETMISNNLQTNILNYVSITKIVLPYMMKIKSGKFIYLSSFRSQISTRSIP